MRDDFLLDKYSVFIGRLGDIASVFEELPKSVVVTDENVNKAQSKILDEYFKSCSRLVLPPGEQTKSVDSLNRVYSFLAEEKVTREGNVIAFGGGVIGDLVGFAAATYMRGIDCMQIPTSLMAMVDSCVGGKTGINLSFGKNLVGAYAFAKGIYVDVGLLATLPEREISSGMAEVLKYGLLGGGELLEMLEQEGRPFSIEEVVRRSLGLKLKFVEKDPYEEEKNSKRFFLNLGHTFAHALESATEYQEFLHGEAVGLGLLMAVRLSEKLGFLDSSVYSRVDKLLASYNLPRGCPAGLGTGLLMEKMLLDKKRQYCGFKLILLAQIGKPFIFDCDDERLLIDLWKEFGAS